MVRQAPRTVHKKEQRISPTLSVKVDTASFLDPYRLCEMVNWEQRRGDSVSFVREERRLTTHPIRKGGLQSDELREAELTGDRQ
jgi:hypothetical protein